jgi:hypothetical protein
VLKHAVGFVERVKRRFLGCESDDRGECTRIDTMLEFMRVAKDTLTIPEREAVIFLIEKL